MSTSESTPDEALQRKLEYDKQEKEYLQKFVDDPIDR